MTTRDRWPWDGVVTSHPDVERCGVAKFSRQLAARLGVPCLAIGDVRWRDRPLYSVKWTELTEPQQRDIAWASHDVLWHDLPAWIITPKGGHRHFALPQIGVPSLVDPTPLADTALFTFGFSHKFEVGLFEALREKVGAVPLWISTAQHEGATESRLPRLLKVWPEAVFLGELSDAALQLVWPRCRALLAFFAGGLRANNTTVHAALEAGVPVITNWGTDTPDDLRSVTVDLPKLTIEYVEDSVGGMGMSMSPYTWARLLEAIACRD